MLLGKIVIWGFKASDEVYQFGVGIWWAISDLEFVLGVKSADTEGESKKLALFIDTLPWNLSILTIKYIFSRLPPFYPMKFMLSSRKYIRSHSSCIQSFILLEIADIYPVSFTRHHPFYCEIEPLQMAFSIRVYSHIAIIL